MGRCKLRLRGCDLGLSLIACDPIAPAQLPAKNANRLLTGVMLRQTHTQQISTHAVLHCQARIPAHLL